MKKQEIIEMDNHELINTFEKISTEITKSINFSSRGVSPKLLKELDWVREEIITRMR